MGFFFKKKLNLNLNLNFALLCVWHPAQLFGTRAAGANAARDGITVLPLFRSPPRCPVCAVVCEEGREGGCNPPSASLFSFSRSSSSPSSSSSFPCARAHSAPLETTRASDCAPVCSGARYHHCSRPVLSTRTCRYTAGE